MVRYNLKNNRKIVGGRIKGTSAFSIKQAHEVDEVSWSNNRFESTFDKSDNEIK